MDYAQARAAFFVPRESAPQRGEPASPARGLRDAMEPIATICFWSEPANDAYAALGLDFLTGYVWGRASVLGEPGPAVVAAAFGVFEPGLVAQLYTAGRAAASLAQVRAARERGSTTALERALGSDGDTAEAVTGAVAALRRGVEAADPAGRALFAGLTELPWPEHPYGRLWHATTMLREYRGDSHLAACAVAGLSGLEANLLTELRVGWPEQAYAATRGWSADAMAAAAAGLRSRGLVSDGALSAAGTALRDDIERTTDALLAPVIDAIGADLPALVARLDDWSTRIIRAGWFPPDPLKRASG